MPLSLKEMLRLVDRSLVDTVKMFFRCPYGFHGDSGLHHYLYHRILANGIEQLIYPEGEQGLEKATLLVQVEHYTRTKYQKTGRRPQSGQFDIALVAPESIKNNGGIPDATKGDAIVAIEVGRIKATDKLGPMGIDAMVEGMKPGDGAKVVGEIRLAGLKVGYVLEFFDSEADLPTAIEMADRFQSECSDLAGGELRVLIAIRHNQEDHRIWYYPSAWGEELKLPYRILDLTKRPERKSPENRVAFADFVGRCGEGGKAIQEALRLHFRKSLDLLYGGKRMSANLDGERLFYANNGTHPEGEQLYDFHRSLAEELHRSLPAACFQGDRLHVPAHLDAPLIDSLVKSLQLLLPDTQ
jgi:hypothetical protein